MLGRFGTYWITRIFDKASSSKAIVMSSGKILSIMNSTDYLIFSDEIFKYIVKPT